jgi:Putative peptidoglycan binding domain
MPKQPVGEGESTSSLAKKNGFFWKTIWDHGENAELKAKRKDPNVLFAEDEIFIPEKELKDIGKPTDQTHKFKRKGEPCKLKVQLLKAGQPRKNEKYTLNLDGKLIEGSTDGEGKLEHFIPGESQSAALLLRGGQEIIPLRLGDLDPVDLATGVQQRLNNLGFDCGSEDGEVGDVTKEAIKKFQAANDLNVTGEADDAMKNKLKELSK